MRLPVWTTLDNMENQVRRKMAALKVLPARSNVSVQNLNPLWLVSHTVVRKKKGGNWVLIRSSRLPHGGFCPWFPNFNSRRAAGLWNNSLQHVVHDYLLLNHEGYRVFAKRANSNAPPCTPSLPKVLRTEVWVLEWFFSVSVIKTLDICVALFTIFIIRTQCLQLKFKFI